MVTKSPARENLASSINKTEMFLLATEKNNGLVLYCQPSEKMSSSKAVILFRSAEFTQKRFKRFI